MKPRARTLLAFAVAPLAVPLIMTPFGLIAGLQFHAAGLAAALVWAFGSAFAYGGAIVLGVPTYLLLRQWLRASLGFWTCLGGVIGVLTFPVLPLMIIWADDPTSDDVLVGLALMIAPATAGLGGIVGLVAYQIAGSDRG